MLRTVKYVSRAKNKYAKAKFSGQSRASWLPNPQKAFQQDDDLFKRDNTGAPNDNIVQNDLNLALLNIF